MLPLSLAGYHNLAIIQLKTKRILFTPHLPHFIFTANRPSIVLASPITMCNIVRMSMASRTVTSNGGSISLQAHYVMGGLVLARHVPKPVISLRNTKRYRKS